MKLNGSEITVLIDALREYKFSLPKLTENSSPIRKQTDNIIEGLSSELKYARTKNMIVEFKIK